MSYIPPRPARDIPHLLVPEKKKISHWNDRNELRVNNWIEPWDFASPLDVGIINVPFSKTSILPNGAYAAPNAMRDAWAIFTTFTPDYDVDMSTLRVRDIGDVSTPIIDLMQGLANIQECLQACMSQPEGFFPVIIGGDHAITAPAVRAYCDAHPDQQVGLIHFDAHNDVRVMDHGPTNGTPIRGTPPPRPTGCIRSTCWRRSSWWARIRGWRRSTSWSWTPRATWPRSRPAPSARPSSPSWPASSCVATTAGGATTRRRSATSRA